MLQRTFVIGDIHGCYDEFLELLEQAQVTDQDRVVALGDIVDRGGQSLELYRYFKNREHEVVLMGNHERKHQRGVLSYAQEIVKVQMGTAYGEFLEWTHTLPYFYETPEALIVHAFYEHDQPLNRQREDVLSGTTSGSRYLEEKYGDGSHWQDHYLGTKPIVYGHHVVGDAPLIKNNTYGIDTGACHGGYLTALELPGFRIHQVKVQHNHWTLEQRKWQVPVLEARKWDTLGFEQIVKQIKQLSFRVDPDVKAFLSDLTHWLDQLQAALPTLCEKLWEITDQLRHQHGVHFGREAAQLPYASLLFQCQRGKLDIPLLAATLTTPRQVIQLAASLDVHLPNFRSGT